MSEADLFAIDPLLTTKLREVLSVENAVASRTTFGGTAPVRVREQLADLARAMESDRAWANSVSSAQ